MSQIVKSYNLLPECAEGSAAGSRIFMQIIKILRLHRLLPLLPKDTFLACTLFPLQKAEEIAYFFVLLLEPAIQPVKIGTDFGYFLQNIVM